VTTPFTVGGEFGLVAPHGAPADSSLARRLDRLASPRPLVLTRSGREAIRLWLRAQAEVGRSRLVLPAYLCPSIVEASLGAARRWDLRFVAIGPSWYPEARDWEDAVAESPDESVVLAVPLFGWPPAEAVVECLGRLAGAGVPVAWDLTHGLLSAWADDLPGDRVASVRKWVGLSDGGALAAERPTTALASTSPPGGFTELRRAGLAAKAAWTRSGDGGEDGFLGLLARAEAALADDHGVSAMSTESVAQLAGIDTAAIAARRVANARRLLDRLDRGAVEPLFGEVPAGSVPFGLPVLLDDRDRVRLRLSEHRVFCPVHWELPGAVDRERHRSAFALSRRELTIPCDDRYRPEDMDRVAELVNRFAG